MVGDRNLCDHCPIWLQANHHNWDPKPFYLLKCWFDHEGFISFLEEVWNSVPIHEKVNFVLKEKLKLLKSKLKIWNKEVFCIVDLDADKAVSALNSLDLFVSNVSGGVNNDIDVSRSIVSKVVWESMLYREREC